MGLFGPSHEERIAAAEVAIAPYGFRIVPGAETNLLPHAPFVMHAFPERFHVAAHGNIDAADVWAFEYGYTHVDAEGDRHSYHQLIIAAHHPRIAGGAAFAPDPKEWSAVAQALDVLFWIPPFTFLKVFEWLAAAQNPDRIVGHPTFDRLYRVRAASDEAARRAISPKLRETAVRLAFRGAVELRENLLIYSVHDCGFDGQGLVRALGYAAPLVVSAMDESSGAYR